jgi:hypothetical protein
MKLLKNTLETNLSLKLVSLLLGFFCWFVFSQQGSLSLEVPVCGFSDKEQTKKIAGLETVRITLQGKRSELYNLDQKSLGVHVNLDELKAGNHLVQVNPEKLLLPESIKLVHYSPTNPVITVIEESKTI